MKKNSADSVMKVSSDTHRWRMSTIEDLKAKTTFRLNGWQKYLLVAELLRPMYNTESNSGEAIRNRKEEG